MNDQDRRAVEGMARCGIDLEGLIAMFPNFPADEITEVILVVFGLTSLDGLMRTLLY